MNFTYACHLIKILFCSLFCGKRVWLIIDQSWVRTHWAKDFAFFD